MKYFLALSTYRNYINLNLPVIIVLSNFIYKALFYNRKYNIIPYKVKDKKMKIY